MYKTWVDTKKYRNKLSHSFDQTRVHDCFNKEQQNMKEYIDADELWSRISKQIKDQEVLNTIEDLLSQDI